MRDPISRASAARSQGRLRRGPWLNCWTHQGEPSVLNRASGVPRGITTPDKPNISSTIWRTVADQKQLVYYYESTFSPSVVWVKFADLDFRPEAGVRKLQLDGQPDRAGDQTRGFEPAKPFRFLRQR